MNYSDIIDLILILMWIVVLSLNTYLFGYGDGVRAARRARAKEERK
jgi:hypothetical protein